MLVATRKLACMARALPFEDRRQQSDELFQGSGNLQSEDAQKLARHVAAIYSLTDQALDRAILSFTP